jgi:long-chain fatty acid transport protein
LTRKHLASVCAALALLVFASSVAEAGGLTLPFRGARPMGRGGTFVAGGDDAGAMAFNPANLAEIDHFSFLVDGGLVLERSNYDRIDSGGNAQPRVESSMVILPIPTLALTYKPKKYPWLTVYGGVWVPYLGLSSWPELGAQRYSSISLSGSLLVNLQLGAAFRVHEHVSIGFGLQNMFLRFKTRVMLSACPELNCAPEDPGFDALTELDASSFFTPSAIVGLNVAYPLWRFGFSFQLPFWVRATGNVYSRLPTDPFFTNAQVVGTAANLDFNLPPILRAGVEVRAIRRVRLEVGLDWEIWRIQKDFTITPQNIYIDGVPGIGRYYLPSLKVNRSLDDSVAVRLGMEAEAVKRRLWLRAGYIFESSATPLKTTSALSGDGMKNIITFGGSIKLGPVRGDLGYAHVFTIDRNVPLPANPDMPGPNDAQGWQVNPIQPSLNVPINAGTYRTDADVIAIGLNADW